ncbi:MAG: ABC transporter permease subunit [Deferribacterales bacterium]
MDKSYKIKKKIIDKVAKYTISIGGIGTIFAVLLVFFFLFYTVLPLFQKGDTKFQNKIVLKDKINPVHGIVDEYGVTGVIFDGKMIDVISLATGEILSKIPLDETLSTFNYNSKNRSYIFGTTDGRIIEADISFKREEMESDLEGTKNEDKFVVENDYLVEYKNGKKNTYKIDITTKELLKLNNRIILVDGIFQDRESSIVAITDDGLLHIIHIQIKENILTGENNKEIEDKSIDLKDYFKSGYPDYSKINSSGNGIFIFFKDGRFINIDARNLDDLKITEDKKILENRKITYLDFLIGRNTILIGDDKGYVTTWWLTEDKLNKNNYIFTNIHKFYTGSDSDVKFIYPSQRDKSFAVLNGDGIFSIFHMTSENLLFQSREEFKASLILMNQKNDKIFLISEDRYSSYSFNVPHPEVSLKTLFGRVQYELTSKGEYVWQSSSGSDDFEPKFSLIPLIFGTIKSTIIAMLFAIPIAILAAIYTSEFVNKKYRNSIKSTIEIMASLPSVVLGFLAGLIISPLVENVVLSLIGCLFMVPFSMLLLGNIIQILPKDLFNYLSRYRIFMILIFALPLGIFLGVNLARIAEKILFYNDFKYWLQNYEYSPLGGWFIVLTPLGLILTIYVYRRFLYGFYENILEGRSYNAAAVIEVIKFLVLTFFTILTTFLIAYIITKIGLDLRRDLPFIERIMGTYVQRNALIVGFVMGFAVIPIIYTVSEDALRAVPEHLRSASLATGATIWQTAVNIVLPVAASGIFSAIMIGFGRAIGETMIVLMAAGNTPIIDMNIFSGFRTLSANIAVELPEAVIGSTHYRILYLAALVLFIMTFIVNTIAELVRIRYRKKSSQL